MKLENSGTKIPNANLTEIGPSFDLMVRRTKTCSEELYKKAQKQPKEIAVNIFEFFRFLMDRFFLKQKNY